jgi:hypothetical protein
MKIIINQYLSEHDKFIKLGMHTPHVTPQELTKWNIQLVHILSDIVFLIPARFNFL